MLKSLNVWSIPGGLDGSLEPSEALNIAKNAGFEAVEFGISSEGPVSLGLTEDKAKGIAGEAHALGLSLPSTASGLYWGRALGDSNPAARKGAQEDLIKMVQVSSWLGAKTHLTIPGAVDVFFLPDRPAQSYDEVNRNAIEGLKAVLPAAEKAGVRLGLENVWNKYLLSPLELAAFIDSFDSKFLGAYVDVANVLPFGFPEQWLRILGHRVVGVHFKDYRKAVGTAEGFVDLLEGDVNWPEVVAALGEIGYDGPVAAEMIPLYKHYPLVRVQNASRAMDAILGRS